MPSKQKRHVTECCGRKIVESNLIKYPAYRRGFSNWRCKDSMQIGPNIFACPSKNQETDHNKYPEPVPEVKEDNWPEWIPVDRQGKPQPYWFKVNNRMEDYHKAMQEWENESNKKPGVDQDTENEEKIVVYYVTACCNRTLDGKQLIRQESLFPDHPPLRLCRDSFKIPGGRWSCTYRIENL